MIEESIPYLTIDDKLNTSVLDQYSSPALIIEGKSDYEICAKILENSKLDWERIDFVVCQCKNEFIKQYHLGIAFPYVALLDSDYDRIENRLIQDERILYTHFYCIENYLTQHEVIAKTVKDFTNIRTNITAEKILKEVISLLFEYIVLCYIKQKENWAFELEGISIIRWWDHDNYCLKNLEIFDYVSEQLRRFNITYDRSIYIKYERILIEKKYPIDLIISGKRKLEVVHLLFNKYFHSQMKKRTYAVFVVDLLKNINSSAECMVLVQSIDNRFLTLGLINGIES